MIKYLLPLLLLPLLNLQAEIRGAWVASVHNINFPSRSGLPAEAQKAEIIRILDTARQAGLNALMVQVRPESDALYPSSLEPWSKYLTGQQGQAPGFDPLGFFISEGKRRGIGIHAWLNPYRAAANASTPRTSSHVSKRFPQYAYKIGNVLWMDPGAPQVQDHIVNVVRDILRRYDVAGIHFDDYFYPYPTPQGGLPNFPDDRTYEAYRSRGGSLSKADWRRENVNTLIRRVGEVVRSAKPGAKFGVSPFGIYMPGVPAGTQAGVNQYGQLFSDPVKWMSQGWIDYLAPQLYWRDGGPQSFTLLLRWWRSPAANPRQVAILPGIAVDRMTSHGWPLSEISTQIRLEKSIGPNAGAGYLLWNIKALQSNTKGLKGLF
jgi:uncharacterized lipoprotein YddW (UPF0748 family)